MQRKPLYPVANCNIKMPEAIHSDCIPEDDGDQQQRRLQLINFGHSQWGFNNWSWSVTKQELDFVDAANGKFTAGVVAFVSISVKSLDIHRENIGYATSLGSNKGYAIYKSRKCAVTNALRETLLSFGGSVATELGELLETLREPETVHENNQNIPNQPAPVPTIDRPKNLPECANRPPPAVSNPCANTAPPPPPPAAVVAPPMPPCPLAPPRSAPPPGRAPRSNEQEGVKSAEAGEEARAERKRRQRQAQEEFRLKQLMKGKDKDGKPEPHKNSSGFDKLLLEIPTQDIQIEETGSSHKEDNKRKSPAPEGSCKKRVMNKLDFVPKK